jgi:hypothetical protein
MVELAVAAAEAQFPPNVKGDGDASRARLGEDSKLLAQAHAKDSICKEKAIVQLRA